MHYVMVETSAGRQYVAIGQIMLVAGTGVTGARLTLSNSDTIDFEETAESFVARVDNGQMRPLPRKAA